MREANPASGRRGTQFEMSQHTREPRKPVQIGVRLKDDAGWSDAQILNVSSRGVMALCQDPPRRGSYVEIRRGTYVMVGRVAWTGADRIGVHVRERIVVEDLLLPVSPGRKTSRPPSDVQMRVCKRRKPSPDERAAASLRFARAFDFTAIAVIAIGLAVVASGVASHAFAGPMADLELALKGSEP
jgi:hypothetical protein